MVVVLTSYTVSDMLSGRFVGCCGFTPEVKLYEVSPEFSVRPSPLDMPFTKFNL